MHVIDMHCDTIATIHSVQETRLSLSGEAMPVPPSLRESSLCIDLQKMKKAAISCRTLLFTPILAGTANR